MGQCSSFSDGQKAKRFTHLLDDTKSTCSTTSSSSQPAGSVAESTISRDSASTAARWHINLTRNDDPNNNDNDNESTASLAPLSKSVVDQFHKFAVSLEIPLFNFDFCQIESFDLNHYENILDH